MNFENQQSGKVIAVLPKKTLIRHTVFPFEYLLIPKGYLDFGLIKKDSIKPGQIISYDTTIAKDGSLVAYEVNILKEESFLEVDKVEDIEVDTSGK